MAGKKSSFFKKKLKNILAPRVCIFQLMTCIQLEAIQLSTHTDKSPCILAGRLYGIASGADYRSKEAGEKRIKKAHTKMWVKIQTNLKDNQDMCS